MKGKRSAKSTGGKIALIILILVAVAAGGIAWWLLGSGGPAPAAESAAPAASVQPTPSPTALMFHSMMYHSSVPS
ncbi:hypothetical protein [Flavonifractor plautii]|uniref:hypothetical protein n=1 Tax=Flavonifractor plautii TaxID=292800 RepID=UPI001959498C|nr:hypothetical protein [Flavonifractor plautii]MBM6664705.1 hypothetical protein [Flavonifractor plautii]